MSEQVDVETGEIVVYENGAVSCAPAVTESQKELIKTTVAVGATDDELELFMFECRRRNVHPLDRLIHFVKRSGKVAFQCGIDFMRSQAEGTGEYRGQDDIEYGPMVSNFPEWARATVNRKDKETGEVFRVTATTYWSEFYPGDAQGFMWKKMPRHMLGKCAESQALRKAFPRELGGLYSHEEMEQAENNQAPARPALQKPRAIGETPPAPVPAPAPAPEPDQPSPETPTIVEGDSTPAQRKLVNTKLSIAGYKTDSVRHARLSDICKRAIKSVDELNKGEVTTIVEMLNAEAPKKDEPGSDG